MFSYFSRAGEALSSAASAAASTFTGLVSATTPSATATPNIPLLPPIPENTTAAAATAQPAYEEIITMGHMPTNVIQPAEPITVKAPPKLPLLFRELSSYAKVASDKSKANESAHDVDPKNRFKDGLLDLTKKEYIKENEIDSPASVLEAAASEQYYYLAPENVARARAIVKYDSEGVPHYCGVASKELAGATALAHRGFPKDLLQNKRAVKDTARVFASSHIAGEDDLTAFNVVWYTDKSGALRLARLDLDMSRWPIHYLFKDFTVKHWSILGYNVVKPFNKLARSRNVDNYAPLEADIRHSPLFTENKDRTHAHYHWVGRGTYRVTSQSASSDRKSSATVTSGDLPVSIAPDQKKILDDLSKDPDYIKESFTVYLKYILSDADIHDKNNRLHIPEHLKYTGDVETYKGKNVLSMLRPYESTRIEQYRRRLTHMPEFADFLAQHGEWALNEIKTEIRASNINLVRKADKNKHKLQNLRDELALYVKHQNQQQVIRVTEAIAAREKKISIYDQRIKMQTIDVSIFDARFQVIWDDTKEIHRSSVMSFDITDNQEIQLSDSADLLERTALTAAETQPLLTPSPVDNTPAPAANVTPTLDAPLEPKLTIPRSSSLSKLNFIAEANRGRQHLRSSENMVDAQKPRSQSQPVMARRAGYGTFS